MRKRTKGDETVPAEWGDPSGPFPLFVFADEDWGKIAKFFGPDIETEKARKKLEELISRYRRFVVNDTLRTSPADVRKALDGLSSAAGMLIERLSLMLHNRDEVHFVMNIAAAEEEKLTSSDADRRLETVRQEVGHLERWATRATTLITDSKPGPYSANVYWFITALDDFLYEFARRRITRSSNRNSPTDFVRAVFAVADRRIGPGAIDAGMKDCIARRGRNTS